LLFSVRARIGHAIDIDLPDIDLKPFG